MDTNSLRWRKKIAKALVRIAGPVIVDDYLRVARQLPMYSGSSYEEIAEKAAPRFVETLMMGDEPLWPDFPRLVLDELKSYRVKRLVERVE
ncbi:MAG: hypothetical protein JNL11_03275 [Bdellovibrionaceae bacterium]|nr:hypothetical protein [Pseudobdellovibrionaceae bacterium]